MDVRRQDGFALVVALMVTLLMTTLVAALLLAISSETMIAANFRRGQDAMYAADAALELATVDLAVMADWTQALNGSVQSTFADGRPNGVRTLVDGSTLDLAQVVNTANCHTSTTCTGAEMDAVTAERPWGANNPRWQLFAYGPLKGVLPPGAIDSPCYVVVLAGDDPSENDENPVADGADPPNPGAGILVLHAEAFGLRGAHKVVELTIARVSAGVRVLSWREVR